ncbi:MAG TPA: sulfatase [Lacipirellula sp.]
MRNLSTALLALFVASFAPLWSASSRAAAGDRPNFVFIIADDVSHDDIGAFGNPVIKTPNLDQLAAEGLAFDRAYLTTSSCSPTRCSIITGRYPHNTGSPELHMPLPKGQYMFPQALREAGYHTVLAGKNHMGNAIREAFDEVTNPAGPGGERNWVKHLKQRPKDKPFFMWFASTDAHRDWEMTEEDPQYDPADVIVPPYLIDGPITRQDLANHYHEISRLDRFVGNVRKELERQGVAENTYVIFSVDNGRPFPRCKTRLYDSGTKNPFIVWRPGTIEPARTESLVSAIDIAPTVLELAGVDVDERVQGISFAPILKDPQAVVRDYAFAEHNWHVAAAHERSVRHGDWLYIRNNLPNVLNMAAESGPVFPAGKELWDAHEAGETNAAQNNPFLHPAPREELYDAKADPEQLKNLLADPSHAETLVQLRSVLDRWSEETGDSVPAHPTPSVKLFGARQHLQPEFKRGPMPGEDRGAAEINAPGPVRE